MGGIVQIRYTADAILIAGGMTLVIVIVLTLFACFTNIDFTRCSIFLLLLFFILILMGIVSTLLYLTTNWQAARYVHVAYAGLGTFVISFKLVFDTQRILIGKFKYTYSP